MNIVDIIIFIILAFGALLGFKRGFTRTLVESLGLIVVIVLAFYLKNPLSVFLYENLPFFSFGALKGVEILNILLYEVIAFFIVFAVLLLILRLIVFASKVFENILTATVILAIPSRIAGAILGVIEYYIVVFAILYVISLPFFSSVASFVDNSNTANKILNNTPILSQTIDKTSVVVSEFITLKNKYNDKTISQYDFNYQAIELFLKYKVVTPDSVSKLIQKEKIEPFDNQNALLDKYREV